MKKNRPQQLLSLFLASSVSLTVAAQEKPADKQSSTRNPIEEVVVTARKRSETIQDIPLALSAIDSQSLTLNGINGLSDLQAHAPSLTLYAARGTSSTATAYIRGIGQSDPLWGVEPGVGIYLDDVYLARPQAALLDMLDVERIEVLRGPQGTLYGRNTIGGAIKYITKKPTDELSGQADLALGSYGQHDLRAAISGPLGSEKLLGGIAIGSFNRDGFGENLATGEDVSNKKLNTVRANLSYLPSDDWVISLALDSTRDRSNVRGAQRMISNVFEPYFEGEAPLPVSDDRYDVNNGFDNQISNTDSHGASLTASYVGEGDWSIKSVTAWRKGETEAAIDFDLGPYPIADVDGVYFDRQVSQELQLNYDGETLQAVMGLYLMQAKAGGSVRNRFGLPFAALGLAPPTQIPGPIFTVYGSSSGQVDTESAALYGDMTWAFSSQWNLSAGLRIGTEKKEAEVLNQGYTDNTFSQILGDPTADFTNDERWTDVSPRISVDYRSSENVLSYASIAKGFKSGGFNTRANTVQVPESEEAYEPESVVTYELGIKTTIAEQFQLNLAVFHSDYRDIQLSIFTGIDSNDDGNNDSFFGDFTNAGKGTIQGAELDYTWSPIEAFNLKGNIAYLDANFQEYITNGVNVADDREFTDIPELAYSLHVHGHWTIGTLGDLDAILGYSWRDGVQPVTNQSELLYQDSFGLWNATLTLTADSGWSLSLEGKNLADKVYRTTGYDLRDSGFPIVTAYYGDPRTVTMRVAYSF